MTPTSTRFRPQGPSGSTRRSAGFTLIELLIAIAVIGILASIAYPQYTEYVKSARVADGKALVMSTAGALERCYTVDNSYADCISTFPLVSDEQFYEITSANYTASFATYTLKATAEDADLVKCAWLQVNHTGERDSDKDCW